MFTETEKSKEKNIRNSRWKQLFIVSNFIDWDWQVNIFYQLIKSWNLKQKHTLSGKYQEKTNPTKRDALDVVWPRLECAAVRELVELLGEAFKVPLGLLEVFVLFIVGGCREGQAFRNANHRGKQHRWHLTDEAVPLIACKQMQNGINLMTDWIVQIYFPDVH